MSNIWAPVIIQMGQAANYADFAAFQASVIANALTFVTNTLNYTSEAGDTFTFYANSKTTPRVNGTTVNLNPTKTYDSPYLSMIHGTDLATVSYPGYENLLLNFDPGCHRLRRGHRQRPSLSECLHPSPTPSPASPWIPAAIANWC